MANILKVHEQQVIAELWARGWSRRRIARELNLDRKTVRRHLRRAKSPTLSTPGAPELNPLKSPGVSTPGSEPVSKPLEETLSSENGRPSLCDPHQELIASKVESGLSAQRIFQDLIGEVGFGGSYQSVKRFVRGLKAAEPQRVWRVEVQPGEEAQIDFGAGAPIVSTEGSRRRSWVLRMVLSNSRKAYSEAVFHQTTENLIRCLENAFRSFGGVPRVLNLDNLKAAVQRADWYDPEFNPKLLSFCRHYGTALLPCRPRVPEHKGKTERAIAYLKGNALKGRQFESLAALNAFLREWERTVADVRIHGTTRQQVAAVFAQEKSCLLPLPPDLFPCFQEAQRTVHRDCYVEVAKAYYAVPAEYLRREVWVRWDGREVRVFNLRFEQIALHPRQDPGRFTRPLGLAGGQGPLQRQIDYWQTRCAELGEPCGQWARGLVERKGPIAVRSLIGLTGLLDQHSFKALNQACAHALSHGAWRLRDVRALLDHPQVQTHLAFAQSHPLIRNLAEYGLFIHTHTQNHD
jgi:transposase